MEKEIKQYEEKVDSMTLMVESTKVTNKEEAEAITDKVKNVKLLKKALTEKMEKITAPAKAIIKEAKETYDPFIKKCEWAERELKGKFSKYIDEKEEEAKKEELKIAKKVESGYIKPETAVEKLDKIESVGKSVKGKGGSTLTVKKVAVPVIKEPEKVPHEFWEINVPMVNKEALRRHKEGLEQIPGVEVEIKNETSIR